MSGGTNQPIEKMTAVRRDAALALSAAAFAACGLPALPALAADTAGVPGSPAVNDAPGVSARDTEPLSEQRPVFPLNPDRPAPARTPLMSLFDQVGLGKTLDDARIRVYGHVEGSYTYNLDKPFRDVNAGRVFDIENESPLLNQLSLNVQRHVVISGREFDVGGRVEFMFGTDARFIHANGLLDFHDNDSPAAPPRPRRSSTSRKPTPTWPSPSATACGSGRASSATSSTIDPNASVFYSHSYTFGAALPFTLTGIYGTYQFNDQLTVDAGISRGWDQALEDNNGAIDFFGRVKYNFSRDTSVAAAVHHRPRATR